MNPRLQVVMIIIAVVPLIILPFVARPPRFTHTGTVKIDDAPFEPAGCVAIPFPAGIELSDGRGARITMTLPGTQVRIWSAVEGTPRVVVTVPSAGTVELGECGTLSVEGEGYHGQGKRAVGGHAALSCSGTTTLWANMDFDGCF